MKLLASISKNYATISASHHDCNVAPDGTLADGGQPNLQGDSGYFRSSGKIAWIELPNMDFAELMNDYKNNRGDSRKYGIHKIEEVRILDEREVPDVDSFDWKLDNWLWGTRGKSGKDPFRYILLKNAGTKHLLNILGDFPKLKGELTGQIIKEILCSREENINRVSGDCICEICGKSYYDHNWHNRISEKDKEAKHYWATLLCDGKVVKL